MLEVRLYKVFCSLGCKRSCTHLAKGICQVVCKVLIWVYKVKDKGKSQAGGLGTGCRSRGPNQDKSLVFAIVIFSVICFSYLQVRLFLYTNILV